MKRLCVVLVMVFLWFSAGVANAATALLVGGAGQYATLTDERMASPSADISLIHETNQSVTGR